jgi:hypothetical protein
LKPSTQPYSHHCCFNTLLLPSGAVQAATAAAEGADISVQSSSTSGSGATTSTSSSSSSSSSDDANKGQAATVSLLQGADDAAAAGERWCQLPSSCNLHGLLLPVVVWQN